MRQNPALGVDPPQQYVRGAACPLGDLGGGDSGAEPCRYGGVPEVVRATGDKRRGLAPGKGRCPRRVEHLEIRAVGERAVCNSVRHSRSGDCGRDGHGRGQRGGRSCRVEVIDRSGPSEGRGRDTALGRVRRRRSGVTGLSSPDRARIAGAWSWRCRATGVERRDRPERPSCA